MNVRNHLAGTMQPAVILKGHIIVRVTMVMWVMDWNVQVSRHEFCLKHILLEPIIMINFTNFPVQ